ncbi:hypothetical protein JHD48_10105 [Sulfurimonas sp. SAG-AH-194-I05]|nr:hypothetical protein [Sulfurimonas sp. SAG-AH-194-I05]MDF1876088.1 hypothetical protein [Sulfurimonas sp. SAG-AH-194-I05]
MININILTNTITNELPHYGSQMFLLGGFYIYLAYLFTRNISAKFAKIFIFVFALFLLYETLSSSKILFNEMLYVAIGIFYTQRNLFRFKKPGNSNKRFINISKPVIVDNSNAQEDPKQSFSDGTDLKAVQKKSTKEYQKRQTIDEIVDEISNF